MPRRPSIDLPHVTLHVVQRGNDRRPCFFTTADYGRYRCDLREIALREGCEIHAYVLMTNHVHLLMTPSAVGQVARIMQALGRRYVRYVNDRYHRTGTLWEGRYRTCLVGTERYLLRCYRYIELNPVRAAMVRQPDDYRWSSYRSNAFGAFDPLVRPHASYVALGIDSEQRCTAYREFVAQATGETELDEIRLLLQRQHAFGPDRFRDAIEVQPGRRAGPAKIGRPAKKTHAPATGESVL
ncbi:MAG TPA: transposase [Rhodanobacteraceae bacterium]|jgi:putative transposase|nr:transposase [Rhodanobacteraceae bacterium]